MKGEGRRETGEGRTEKGEGRCSGGAEERTVWSGRSLKYIDNYYYIREGQRGKTTNLSAGARADATVETRAVCSVVCSAGRALVRRGSGSGSGSGSLVLNCGLRGKEENKR